MVLITQGEPIKVGHHSERRHRKHLERLQNKGSKGVQLLKEAEELETKASNLEVMSRRKRGRAEERDERIREFYRKRFKDGKKRVFYHGAAFGRGTMEKIFKKSVRIKFDSGHQATIQLHLLSIPEET